MKKKILAITLFLVLGLTACGGSKTDTPEKDSAKETAASETETPITAPEETPATEAAAATPATLDEQLGDDTELSLLAAWYNSTDRSDLETSINNVFESQGLHFYAGIQEPDTIIYTYQYTQQMDFADDITDYFDSSMENSASAFISDIKAFQTTYGLPLTTLRLTYLNADGSLVYTTDITEDGIPAAGSNGSLTELGTSVFNSLEDWTKSEDCRTIVAATNESLASSGMTLDYGADGNILIMTYTYLDKLDLSGLTQEEIDSVFASDVVPVIVSNASTIVDSFQAAYGLNIEDLQIIFRDADGTEIFSCYNSEL